MVAAHKACVIIGAGASADVMVQPAPGTRYRNNIEFTPHFVPPLANQLFNFSGATHFDTVISQYPGAEFLAQRLELQAARLGRDFDIEAELRSLAEDTDSLVQKHYKHIPPYLRDLLALSSYHWVPLAAHYTELIRVLVSENQMDVLFLVLNYDTLLETALTRYNSDWIFDSIYDYVGENRKVKVVKLHGSVDWFKSIGSNSTGKTWDDLVNETDVLSKPPESTMLVKNFGGIAGGFTKDIVRGHSIDGNWVYPILTAPLAGKGPKDMVCPDSHDNAAREFLGDCRKFLVIGTNGHDVDLLELLSDSIDPNNRCVLHYVGMNPDAPHALRRFQEQVLAFNRSTTAGGTRLYESGFKQYVNQKGLDEFVSAEAV